MTPGSSSQIVVLLPDSYQAALDIIARSRGTNRSAIVREAVAFYLEAQERPGVANA